MDKLRLEKLNTLLNAFPEGSVGERQECLDIAALDQIGRRIGYGRLEQLAHQLYQIQCLGDIAELEKLKRERFLNLNWPLPKNFDEVCAASRQ
jgi:hypothetical protein